MICLRLPIFRPFPSFQVFSSVLIKQTDCLGITHDSWNGWKRGALALKHIEFLTEQFENSNRGVAVPRKDFNVFLRENPLAE